MGTLYIDRKNVELKLDGKAIACYENGKRNATIPLALIDRIFLKGDITLHANLLGKIGENGIGTVILSGRKNEVSMLFPQPHNDAARRVTQYHLSTDSSYCLRFSCNIIKTKISTHIKLLESLREKNYKARYALSTQIRNLRNSLDIIEKQQDIPSIRGIEGNSAACYFTALAAVLPKKLEFKGRNRRPPKDPFNAVISLGYTLLHSKAVIALYSAGLDPFVGFYHALDFGRESLACDLIESFRGEVDRFAINLFKSGKLKPEDFTKTGDSCLIAKEARSSFYQEYTPFYEKIQPMITKMISDICDAIKQKTDILFPQTRSIKDIKNCDLQQAFETGNYLKQQVA